MASFSTAAVDSACSTICQRVISTLSELDGLVKSGDPASSGVQRLLALSERLSAFREAVETLRESISTATVVSPVVQSGLRTSLQPCSSASATIEKEIIRLQSGFTADAIDTAAVLEYEDHQAANAQLFALFAQILQISSMGAQEEAFASLDGEELLEKGVASSQQAIARSNALGGLLASNSTPDDGPASPLPPYSPSQDIKGKSKESSGFLAILSDSFRTVATNLVRAKPEPMVIAMCEVAKDGDIRHLKGFISQGVNINGQNEDGHTPLICAVRANQLDAINYLASAGADIAAKDSHSGQKKPPLFHAAECGHLSATETLINLGANIHETSWLGQPFFVEVGSSSPLPMLKLFLTHGANPNTTSNTGRSIMVDALRSGSLDRLRLLHEHGGDTNTPDITGQPPLHMALGQNRLDIIDFLLAHGADPNSVSITGKSILHSALQQKLYPLVKTLLIRGANPNVSDLMGTTFLAALVNLTPNPIPTPNSTTADEIVPDLIRLALTKGADPNQTDSWGTPLLSHVLEKGSTPLLRTFLEHRVNPNTPFRDQGTLLLYALEQGRDDQALLLLKHGADPNGRDGKGRTPLMEALQGGRMDVVTALVAVGADVNLGGVVRPVVFARAMGAREVVRLLEAKGAEDVRGVAGGRLAGASVGGLGVPGAGQVGDEEEEEEEVPPAYSEANTL